MKDFGGNKGVWCIDPAVVDVQAKQAPPPPQQKQPQPPPAPASKHKGAASGVGSKSIPVLRPAGATVTIADEERRHLEQERWAGLPAPGNCSADSLWQGATAGMLAHRLKGQGASVWHQGERRFFEGRVEGAPHRRPLLLLLPLLVLGRMLSLLLLLPTAAAGKPQCSTWRAAAAARLAADSLVEGEQLLLLRIRYSDQPGGERRIVAKRQGLWDERRQACRQCRELSSSTLAD